MSGGHKILSLARLPVPPRPHIKFSRPTYSTIFAILLQVLFLVFYKFFYGRALSGSNPLVYMHKTKQAPIGRLPCFGAVKGISKPRFARLPSCGSLFGHLGPRPVQMPTGHFHLRPCPFGFESPDCIYNKRDTPKDVSFVMVRSKGFEPPWSPTRT